jgi:hypothetical protein
VANTEKTDEKADAAPRKREVSKSEQEKIDARRQVRSCAVAAVAAAFAF